MNFLTINTGLINLVLLLHSAILVQGTTPAHRLSIEPPNFAFYTDDLASPWLSGHVLQSTDEQWQTVSETKFTLQSKAEFTISTSSFSNSCFDMRLISNECSFTPHICIDIRHSDWFGGGEIFTQLWPLGDTEITMQPFVPRDLFGSRESYGNVIERYWISTEGVGIFVTHANPLAASFNERGSKRMCFMAPHTKNHANTFAIPNPELEVTVCKTDNIKQTHLLMSAQFIARPTGIPDPKMFRSPLWSTWAKYKVNINDNVILEYADEIKRYNFSNSQLEIDDMFSSTYGDFDFKPNKFANPKSMIRQLKEKGFRVTVWITPFANLDSMAFQEGLQKGYWMKFPKDVPALVRWWQGVGAVLDARNTFATKWFRDRLEEMKQEFGVDAFKFDAGEADYLPDLPAQTVDGMDISTYTTKYVQAVSNLGSFIEVRCGYRTQSVPVFVRMADKSSDWTSGNGLRSLIPVTLTMGLLGYPFILPDMIGGNAYEEITAANINFDQTSLPDRELYIRWLELTAYLPAMQFSIAPWQYDDEVIRIARKYVTIHEELVTPIILQLAEEATRTGAPMIRPLWWIAPTDPEALHCDSQFMIGDQLLVAPIVERGATARDIYLPSGTWRDEITGEVKSAAGWLRQYPCAIDQVPTFTRLSAAKDEL